MTLASYGGCSASGKRSRRQGVGTLWAPARWYVSCRPLRSTLFSPIHDISSLPHPSFNQHL